VPGDEIEQHADATLTGHRAERDQVVVAAVPGGDLQVVRHVVARVAERRGEARVEPDRVHAQPGQVVQVVDDPRQVANPVAVAVRKALRVDLVDDGLV
jgi:hypothetical protein